MLLEQPNVVWLKDIMSSFQSSFVPFILVAGTGLQVREISFLYMGSSLCFTVLLPFICVILHEILIRFGSRWICVCVGGGGGRGVKKILAAIYMYVLLCRK